MTGRMPGGAGWLVAYVPASLFAYPQPLAGSATGLLDLGPLLGPVSVACLLLGLAGLEPRRAAVAGGWAGLAAHVAILHWISIATVRFGHAPPSVGWLAVVGLALYPAVMTAALSAAYAWLRERGLASPFVVAALFVASDHLRTFLLSGFPWALLGYTQHDNPALLPLAAIGGVFLPGFAAALLGTLGAALVMGPIRRGFGQGTFVAGSVLLGLLLLAGAWLGRPDAVDRPRVRVAAIQGNIGQGVKWSAEERRTTLERYVSLSEAAARDGAELIVWPETAVPGPVDYDAEVAETIRSLAQRTGTALVIGGVGLEVDRSTGDVLAWYDSAFVIEPDGRLVARYDKSHLVPFGEYVPFRAVFGSFLTAIARGVAALDVSPGPGPAAIRVFVPAAEPGAGGAVRVGIPICYELLFPDLVRHFADDGAELLVAITNDAWYGRTGAPQQFLMMTAMRAAETGVAIVRAANTGVSALIDRRGRILERTRIFERGYVIGEVHLADPEQATFYVRHGNVFVWGCWLGLGVTMGVGARRRPGSKTDGEVGQGGIRDDREQRQDDRSQ